MLTIGLLAVIGWGTLLIGALLYLLYALNQWSENVKKLRENAEKTSETIEALKEKIENSNFWKVEKES